MNPFKSSKSECLCDRNTVRFVARLVPTEKLRDSVNSPLYRESSILYDENAP